uniref:Meiotically up-regulated gene 147 protein n=1 Tax=Zeugodacus cucurbitae TaxID=28588 RepID=A0A0A1XHW5_ZEUCU
MRRTPKSRKSTKLENSLWHYQKFFREHKQRRIDFMQQKLYRNFHFGNIYSDCFVAVKQLKQQQQQTQTQTQKHNNLKQKQGQVQVAVTVDEVKSSLKQQAARTRVTSARTTLDAITALTKLSKSATTKPNSRKTVTVTIVKTNRHGNTPLKPMPLLTYATLRMSLSLRSAAQLLRQF